MSPWLHFILIFSEMLIGATLIGWPIVGLINAIWISLDSKVFSPPGIIIWILIGPFGYPPLWKLI